MAYQQPRRPALKGTCSCAWKAAGSPSCVLATTLAKAMMQGPQQGLHLRLQNVHGLTLRNMIDYVALQAKRARWDVCTALVPKRLLTAYSPSINVPLAVSHLRSYKRQSADGLHFCGYQEMKKAHPPDGRDVFGGQILAMLNRHKKDKAKMVKASTHMALYGSEVVGIAGKLPNTSQNNEAAYAIRNKQ
eukprot:6264284-Amphidinium_carterae.3